MLQPPTSPDGNTSKKRRDVLMSLRARHPLCLKVCRAWQSIQNRSPRRAFLISSWLALLAMTALWASHGFCSDLGVITGFVKFPGETPPSMMFANRDDHDCPHGIAQNHLLVKQETRSLQNALVVLERQDRRVMPTGVRAQLTTEGCTLVPRIQWIPLGTSLLLVNKDGASHRLRALQGSAAVFDVEMTPGEPPSRRPMVVPGLCKVQCERHLWERAWIYVSPHDSVAITDADGEFVMKNVPPGRYALRAWHEGWTEKAKDKDGRLEFRPMEQTLDVKVRSNKATSVLFENLLPAF